MLHLEIDTNLEGNNTIQPKIIDESVEEEIDEKVFVSDN